MRMLSLSSFIAFFLIFVSAYADSQNTCENIFLQTSKTSLSNSQTKTAEPKSLKQKMAEKKANKNRNQNFQGIKVNQPDEVSTNPQMKKLEEHYKNKTVGELSILLKRNLKIENKPNNYILFLSSFSDLRLRQKLVDTGRFLLSKEDFASLNVKPPASVSMSNINIVKIKDSIAKNKKQKTEKQETLIENEKIELQSEMAAENIKIPDQGFALYQDQMLIKFSEALNELDQYQNHINFLSQYQKFEFLPYAHLKEVFDENHAILIDLFDRYCDDVSNYSFSKALELRLRKQHKFEMLLNHWVARFKSTDFLEIYKSKRPDLLLPHRIYRIETLSGEQIQIRFSESLIKEFFSNTQNSGLHEAAIHAMNAILHGWTPSRSVQGLRLYHISGFENEKPIVKLNLIGNNGVGATRIYAVLEENRIISFSHWEHESNHDSRFIVRACTLTIQKAKLENWPL